jgi:hypothetical protein
MNKTPDSILISALRTLAVDIQSEDGVANAAIAEAADRLEELSLLVGEYRKPSGGIGEALRDTMERVWALERGDRSDESWNS